MHSSVSNNLSPASGLALQPASSRWALWLHQVKAILRLELGKNLFSRRALMVHVLAIAPVLLIAALITLDTGARRDIARNFGQASQIFSAIYEGLILRSAVFFGCAWTFMNLFRGEIVDKSLHYYFLSPVRREVLVIGKYLSGLVSTILLFGGSTLGAIFFIYLAKGYPANIEYLLDGPGLGQVMTWLTMTVLACIGYGAAFMVIGLFFRNPIIPALMIYGWEWLNFLLPPLLKKLSVIHYIHSLSPIPIDEGPLAVVGDPTPAWIAIPGLLLVTALVLIVASRKIRHLEISYGGE
jgi:ABC-type transport system involved in multi-copper enzyme maturation permease subunit